MRKFLEKTKISILHFAPYFLIVLLVVCPWFLKKGYLFFTDFSWGPNIDVSEPTSNWFYFDSAIKAIGSVLPMSLVSKLYITFTFFVCLFAGHTIAKNFSQDRTILFLGSAFVLLSPFVYDRTMYGQFGTLWAYGLFLSSFGYLIAVYFAPHKIKNYLLAGIFSGASFLFSPHFLFFAFLAYLCIFILVFLKKENNFFLKAKIGALFLLSGAISLLINANWIYPLISSSSSKMHAFIEEEITEQHLFAFKTAGGTEKEVLENVFLMSGFWGMEQYRYQSLKEIKENWSKGFYFLLPVIFAGVFLKMKEKKDRKLFLTLIFIFFISFFLALGVAVSFSQESALWMFRNIPFYKGLREPQKWVVLIAAVYEVFLVCGLSLFFNTKVGRINKPLLAFWALFFIILQSPLLLWGAAGQVRPVDYPADWYEADKEIAEETGCQSKILFLPWHLYMDFFWVGNTVANPSPNFFKCPVVYGKNMEFGGIYGVSPDEEGKRVEEWLFFLGGTDFLQREDLDIGHIVLAKDSDWRSYLWIEKYPQIELEKETETLKIYQIIK